MRIPALKTKLMPLFLLVMLLFSSTPVEAAQPAQALQMEAEAAFQGYYKYGEWLPIWVSLENSGPDLSGELQVTVQQDFNQVTYAVPVSLANGARKRLPVYVLPNNFTRELQVALVVGDEALQTQKVLVQPQPNINYLIGGAALERGALARIPAIQLPGGRLPVFMDVTLETLPERPEALRSLDVLILNDVDSSTLTPEQVRALTVWVQQGGRLVIGGGAGAMQTVSGLPTDLLPLQPPFTLEDLESVDALAAFAHADPILVPGPFVTATSTQLHGQVLAKQDQHPLVLERSLGEGTVNFVALDVSALPFDAWSGTTDFWETLLTPGAAYPDWLPPDISAQQMASGPISSALSNIPSLDLPSARSLVVLLVVYILLVGPINYLVLRWRKRLHWAWVTIPLITLVFTGLSFGIGYAKRGTDLIVNKIAILQPQPDGTAQVTSYIGLFSPANQGYEVQIEGANLLSPIYGYYDPWSGSPGGSGNLTFVQSNPSLVRGLNVNQWSMQSFRTETTLDEIGEVQTDLTIASDRLVGTVTNLTGQPLEDVILILRPNFVRIGDLEAGESAEVEMKLAMTQDMLYNPAISWRIYEDQISQPHPVSSQREIDFKRSVLEAMLDQQYYYGTSINPNEVRTAKGLDTLPSVTILGWMDSAPPAVSVNGEPVQEVTNALYMAEAAYDFPQEGAVKIPVGLVPGLVAELPFNGGTCGTGTTSLWIDQGEAILEFVIPAAVGPIQVEKLLFNIQTDSGFLNSPKLEIYDWSAESWQTLDNVSIGLNTIVNAGGFISADQLIRLRLSGANQNFQGGACYYMALGLEGVAE